FEGTNLDATIHLKDFLRFLEALQADDARQVQQILATGRLDIDTVLEVDDPNMLLASYKQGYWLPGYKLEKSWAMALHVCVMYNSLECAVLLIQEGAALNRMPNGKTPLHVACEVSNPECVSLLLEHGAKVEALSLSGHTALHYCITAQSVPCAHHLLLHGANVNIVSSNHDEVTPLHTAARFGIPELVGLYLLNGAQVDTVNSALETPLMTAAFWAYDSREQRYSPEHQLVCRLLLDHGAGQSLGEEDHKTALHKAAWSCDEVLLHMLLEAGADPRAMDINGCSPLHYLLKVSSVRPSATPEKCFQLLLNYNTARIYPPQFHKVLQACHEQPRVVEVMANSYERLKPTKKWRSSIPDESYQRYRAFYDSLFSVSSGPPRSLLHLSRCAVRAALGGMCQRGVELLPLPPAIQRYILLEPEGVLY
uniref:SOCS box domain-containing protein n=1 Tax=Periophthalmus magnuspinnatus TaxID=409849 RepID=A0A3B4AAU6_9GOBI